MGVVSDVEFFRVSSTGRRVHVVDHEAPSATTVALGLTDDEARGSNLVSGRVVARCGVSAVWHVAPRADTFPDEHLCRGCWRATPEADRDRLFEHPTTDVE